MQLNAKTRLTAIDIDKALANLKRRRTGEVDADIGPVKKGAFHRWLGKSEDAPITEADIAKGKASNDPHVRKMANFAENAKHWEH